MISVCEQVPNLPVNAMPNGAEEISDATVQEAATVNEGASTLQGDGGGGPPGLPESHHHTQNLRIPVPVQRVRDEFCRGAVLEKTLAVSPQNTEARSR